MKNPELGSSSGDDDRQRKWGTIRNVKFAGEQQGTERDFVKLEDLEPLFDDKTSFIMGHGTGTAGDGHEIVDSILEEGLRGYQVLEAVNSNKDEAAGSTDLELTAVTLFTAFYGEKPDMTDIRNKLNNWKHRDSQNIILMKFPIEFLNGMTSVDAERYLPFFVQKRDSDGQMRNVVDPRFIIGSYNGETGLVEMNKKFEATPSGEFRSELEERLEEAKSITRKRMQKIDEIFSIGHTNATRGSEDRDDANNDGSIYSVADDDVGDARSVTSEADDDGNWGFGPDDEDDDWE